MRLPLEPPPLNPWCEPLPSVRFLSNGRYRALLTAAGTGCSAVNDVALTRWRADPIEDADGYFFYLRDLDTHRVWSAGLQPSRVVSPGYRARWEPGRFETTRVDEEIESRLEICVSPSFMLELRRLTLRNRSRRRRRIELTSFAEVVLGPGSADAAHPVFSKLFVRTEFAPEQRALMARRQPRGLGEAPPLLFHALLGDGQPQCETDRARFLGRCARAGAPQALRDDHKLSGTTGTVLDPIVCLRHTQELGPGEHTEVTFLLGTASGRTEALTTVQRLSRPGAVESTFLEARARARDELARLGLEPAEAESLQALAGAMHYGSLQTPAEVRERGLEGPQQPPREGLATDGMHVVLRADRCERPDVTADLVDAHRYWQALGLPIDLVVVCDEVPRSVVDALEETPDRLRLMRCTDLAFSDLAWLEATARLVVEDSLPNLAALLHTRPDPVDVEPQRPGGRSRLVLGPRGRRDADTERERHELARSTQTEAARSAARPEADEALELFNGIGGFAADGSEYVVRLRSDATGALTYPPRPWINVIANEGFGFL
ncbi:MAG: hypothetical protein JSW67_02275, partial [Candidatus Latescibacterota bacterium]